SEVSILESLKVVINEFLVQPGINFFQSDCDVALARSFKCLKDYTNNRYCSTKNKSTAGKCSPNIAKHSRLYHKHTGWFSPSK
ncbi:hypothetical protein AAZF84_13160, partial [Bacillus sp. JR_15]